MTDVGMAGPMNSVLGMDPKNVIHRFYTQMPARFKVASGPSMLNGVVVNIDGESEPPLVTDIDAINLKFD